MIEISEGCGTTWWESAAGGKVARADYDDVLITAIQANLKVQDIRLLYHLRPHFTGFPEAICDDAKRLRHMTEFERVAFVTDEDWVRTG